MAARVVSELLALLAPPLCAACRAHLADPREVLCPGCRRSLPWLREPRCERCGLPAPCRDCPVRDGALARAWAPLAYEGAAAALVRALKFRGALPVAELMAAQIAAGAPASLLEGAVLVPVPAHPRRRRSRGFDQAERIAAALQRRTGCPVVAALRRRGPAARQVGAGRLLRREPDRLRIEGVGPAPSVATLVDDVHTTGATLEACARALRAAGAQRVGALTYTRTLPR